MNKRSHISATTRMIQHTALNKYAFWMKLGAIAPDLLLYTYFTGHTYTATEHWFQQSLQHLLQKGRLNRRSCFLLGYLLHYLEDYFTFPHSSAYTGTLTQHIQYEKRLERDLQNYLTEQVPASYEIGPISFQQLQTHYLQQRPDPQTDITYMLLAGSQLCAQMLHSFLENDLQLQPDWEIPTCISSQQICRS